MYETKKRIYIGFEKSQKTALCNFLRAITKQNINIDTNILLEQFIEDEKYYQEINASRFPFLHDYINNEHFIQDTLSYIKACKKYYEYKKSQEPLIKKQKEFEKEKRKFLQEVKMSKEMPTKKQIYYYERLCKKYNLEKLNTEGLSKLDLKKEIGKIIDEYSRNSSHTSE